MELRTLRYFVAVAEELHFGRAARRLHLSQPPLSRAIKHLEADLGATLLHRSPAGVTLTDAGHVLLTEARALLDHAGRIRAKLARTTITVGMLGDHGARVAEAFRRRHPHVEIRVRETDLTDPTCGLRAGHVDVALTRGPFDESGLKTLVLQENPVGAVLRRDDPLAARERITTDDLAGRDWFQFPDGTDEIWRNYWNGGRPRSGPTVRAVQECVQSVLWNGSVGLAPLGHDLGELVVVPLADMSPSPVVIAWISDDPLTLDFVEAAAQAYRAAQGLSRRLTVTA
ncbi:DNA-binding transcriptional regulator, LysR family [Lentzea albidocapillata subsp. violacea]|uniref:DNA-binding transcriptional regulator, LysR family n=1 Tax=Lentzea albidocapillata subsp. violacea TaxID=128104 RepID=A0A1G9XM25_9PSEU|nr:LysR substrate-binding domain-containing protein [Lentzea albidocapillata]SDM97486.1 DNA-binding transcriptional regulator, LysR family [Lentzea albidocapillata subsp. violacea]